MQLIFEETTANYMQLQYAVVSSKNEETTALYAAFSSFFSHNVAVSLE